MINAINKQQLVCSRIALALLVMHLEGKDRLPPIKELATGYGVGLGTVQGAFQTLKDQGAIGLNACGASGTFLVSVNQRKLFDACDYGELICLMPLDGNKYLRGLATGIYEAVSNTNLPIHILFARGSRNRASMVKRQKCNFTVMSQLAYETAIALKGETIELVDQIGEYPGNIGIITRANTPFVQGETKVAFDDHSYDQYALHHLLKLPEEASDDYLDVQLVELVRQGKVESALCERASLKDEAGLCFHTLSGIPQEASDKMRRAVLVIRKGDDSLARLLRCIVTLEKVSTIQNEVLNGSRLVKY